MEIRSRYNLDLLTERTLTAVQRAEHAQIDVYELLRAPARLATDQAHQLHQGAKWPLLQRRTAAMRRRQPVKMARQIGGVRKGAGARASDGHGGLREPRESHTAVR